ncbi:MAG: histidinol dehydrogenase [Candidatus Dormiibacterota bacterium]
MIQVQPLPANGSAGYRRLVDRASTSAAIDSEAAAVLELVKKGGDAAVRVLTRRFDGVDRESTRVDPEELDRALSDAPPELIRALETAARHIARVHGAQRFSEEQVEVLPGVRVGRTWRPLNRVGIYVPGGRAAYPSSVLMMAVPARLAGCREVVLCSPPGRDGRVANSVLAAAAVAAVTEVHAVGGAQAIAALAYGTESIGKVDKVFGPGNQYVTSAKRQVFGEVAVDMPAGPSEVVVIADSSAPPKWVCADLVAQAEHAPDALAVLVTTDAALAAQVQLEIGDRYQDQVRILTADTPQAAFEFTNDFGPEHLILAMQEPERWLSRISSAGSVFLGSSTPAAAGDYATGANHVLPTGGSAGRFSALGLESFGHVIQVQSTSLTGLAQLAPMVREMATVEGFTSHWESVRLRIGEPAKAEPASPRPRSTVSVMHPYQWELSTAEVARKANIEPQAVIRFDTNSSPWEGAELSQLGPCSLNEYPDSTYAELSQAISKYAGAPLDAITIGAGADELLDLLAKAFIAPSDPVLLSDPTYSMYRTLSELAGGYILEVPAQDWELNRRRFLELAPQARLIWLCNPNNPTGELLPLEFVAELARSTAGLLVIDEAYYEFTGSTAADLIGQLPNLVVVRTLSKAFGLAGARVGYAISGSSVAASLQLVRPPGSVSSVAAALGAQALTQAPAMRERVTHLRHLQDQMAAELTGMEWPVRRTPANFILLRATPRLLRELGEQGLVVRTFAEGSSMAGWVRITVRSAAENARLVDAVGKFGSFHGR